MDSSGPNGRVARSVGGLTPVTGDRDDRGRPGHGAADYADRDDDRDYDRGDDRDYDDADDLEWRADDGDVVEWRAEGPATEIIDRSAITRETETITTDGQERSSDPGVVLADPRGARFPRPAADRDDAEGDEGDDGEDLPPGKRVRVVLSQRKGTPSRPVRTVVDVQELTQVGELLSTSLIRSQLSLALRIGGIAAIALGAWPAIFILFPVLGRAELFGLRLPWLLLGVLAYPFMLGLGYLHSRSAEKLEQVFADHIQN